MNKRLNAKEMAELLGISTRQVCRFAKEGFIPGWNPGGRFWTFDPDKVQKAIDALEEKNSSVTQIENFIRANG